MQEFRKPSRKPLEEPPGLAAFAAGAPGTPVLRVVERVEPAAPAERPRTFGMNVKFSAEAKAALQRLATHEQRSQQMILTRLIEPVIIEAARKLDG